jgi:hypothetical protein
VRGFRVLTLFVEYIAGTAESAQTEGLLSMLPEVALALEGSSGVVQPDDLPWYAVGVLDGTLNLSGDTPEPIATPSYALRMGYQSEITVQGTFVNDGADEAFPVRFTLLFDVAAYSWFRLRVGDRNAENSVAKIHYQLQR